VIGSVKSRFEITGRALPWVVTIDKHIRVPRAFLNALEDSSLDKLSLFANDGDRDKHYLVAESFLFCDEELLKLQQQQAQGQLIDYLIQVVNHRNDSVLRNLSANQTQQIAEWLSRNPAMSEDNVGYQIYRGSEVNRVLLIYNVKRLVDFVEKSQLNPNASGKEGLLHKPRALAFHVDPYAKEASITRLQGSME
jgi:hypothetical protein